MDGNGRWATGRGVPRGQGHEAGAESVRVVVRECRKRGVEALTLYSFSTENWKPAAGRGECADDPAEALRPPGTSGTDGAGDTGLCHRADVPASRSSFASHSTSWSMTAREWRHDSQPRTVLRLSCRDGGCSQTGCARCGCWTNRSGRHHGVGHLRSSGRRLACPTPDLLIRTSGELRLSNFLLWQLAYTEIHVTDTYFSQISVSLELDAALVALCWPPSSVRKRPTPKSTRISHVATHHLWRGRPRHRSPCAHLRWGGRCEVAGCRVRRW